MTRSPILFLVFNRPDTTKLVFQAIRDAQPPRLYVASDGPRMSRVGEEEKVQSIRKFIQSSIDWPCVVKYLFREQNHGCGDNVSGAISWFFEHEEMGIILEDDCLPSSSFFSYCDDLLTRYVFDENIMMIAGGNYLFEELPLEHSYAYCKYQLIWGWATWKRAWDKYDPFMTKWPEYSKSMAFLQRVPKYDERTYWRKIFTETYRDGLKSTWDYQWLFSMWMNGGCSIFPNANLISNIGFGKDATHTKKLDPCGLLEASDLVYPLVHPSVIAENELANEIICRNFYMKRRGVAFFSALLTKTFVEFIKIPAKAILAYIEGNKCRFG